MKTQRQIKKDIDKMGKTIQRLSRERSSVAWYRMGKRHDLSLPIGYLFWKRAAMIDVYNTIKK